MIRITDATILAYTKLRTHRIRTGIAVAVSGLMFGLIVIVIVVTQGIYTSIERFQDEGLNNRTILNVSSGGADKGFDTYSHRTDQTFVGEVEAAYKQRIAKKQAIAKKYAVTFTPATDDPSPIVFDKELKQKVLSDSALDAVDVQTVVNEKMQSTTNNFDINHYLKPYSSARVIQKLVSLQPSDGQLKYMKDGKELTQEEESKAATNPVFGAADTPPTLQVVESSLAKPFITDHKFDTSKGEIPVILPYSSAEKLLGLKALSKDASHEQKLARMAEIRQRVSEVVASFCYRNAASQALLSQAKAQQKEIASHARDTDYQKPKLVYEVPGDGECGAVGVASDTRSAVERKSDENMLAYQREIGEQAGDPVQQKLVVRGVGVSSDIGTMSQAWSTTDLVKELFSSWLGYGTWSIPADMLAGLPASARPSAVFDSHADGSTAQLGYSMPESYLVEFGDRTQARALLNNQDFSTNTYAIPFGSGTLIADEMRGWVNAVLQWLFAIFGAIAIAILTSIISRTVAEGRRESAVFRAIGASRADVGVVYGMYTILLSLRVVAFSFIMGIALALSIELTSWRDATLGARLAYAASDTNKEFHLFSLTSPYLLWVIAVILVAGIISAIIPIMLGARRNPIGDMRNDT